MSALLPFLALAPAALCLVLLLVVFSGMFPFEGWLESLLKMMWVLSLVGIAVFLGPTFLFSQVWIIPALVGVAVVGVLLMMAAGYVKRRANQKTLPPSMTFYLTQANTQTNSQTQANHQTH